MKVFISPILDSHTYLSCSNYSISHLPLIRGRLVLPSTISTGKTSGCLCDDWVWRSLVQTSSPLWHGRCWRKVSSFGALPEHVFGSVYRVALILNERNTTEQKPIHGLRLMSWCCNIFVRFMNCCLCLINMPYYIMSFELVQHCL